MACFGEFWVVLAVHLKFRVSNGILNYRQIRLRLYAVFMTDRQLPVYVRFAVKSSRTSSCTQNLSRCALIE